MPKAEPLTLDALATPQVVPKAATPARSPVLAKASEPPVKPQIAHVPLQIRIPKHDARAIRVAAAEREQNISEFMLACFHAFMNSPSR